MERDRERRYLIGAGGRDPLEGDGKGVMEGRARHRKGGAGPWGSGNGRRRPCPSAARENAGGVTTILLVVGAHLAYQTLS